MADLAAPGPGDRQAVPVALPGPGNHWYFYGFDADFGPFYVKFCGYFPFTGQIYFNGHEYAKQQCLKQGITFTSLDNAFGSVSDAGAAQRICDGLDDQKIYRFAGKWLARLPQTQPTFAASILGPCWGMMCTAMAAPAVPKSHGAFPRSHCSSGCRRWLTCYSRGSLA